jgi:hypothetical protein
MKPFPEKLAALKAKLPAKQEIAAVPNGRDYVVIGNQFGPVGVPVENEFINDLIRTGKAVERKPGHPFPPDAEYEIVREGNTRRLIHHQVSIKS